MWILRVSIWNYQSSIQIIDGPPSHKYQRLPLVPVEAFLEQHPEHANGDEKTLMFARINHELSEREALEQQRQELLKQKASLMADNKKRKDDLASLDKDLEKFIDVRAMIVVQYTSRLLRFAGC